MQIEEDDGTLPVEGDQIRYYDPVNEATNNSGK